MVGLDDFTIVLTSSSLIPCFVFIRIEPATRRDTTRKFGRILESANIILLVVTHWWQSFNDSADLFQGHDTIKAMYYGCEVLYALAHVIVLLEFSFGQLVMWSAENVFGSLGFELILWTSASRPVWVLINLGIIVFASACIMDKVFFDLLRETFQPLGDDPFSEVHLDMV